VDGHPPPSAIQYRWRPGPRQLSGYPSSGHQPANELDRVSDRQSLATNRCMRYTLHHSQQTHATLPHAPPPYPSTVTHEVAGDSVAAALLWQRNTAGPAPWHVRCSYMRSQGLCGPICCSRAWRRGFPEGLSARHPQCSGRHIAGCHEPVGVKTLDQGDHVLPPHRYQQPLTSRQQPVNTTDPPHWAVRSSWQLTRHNRPHPS